MFKYNKSTHSLIQQPEYKQPNDMNYRDMLSYIAAKKTYDNMLASLKTYPVSGNCSWEDGQILGDKDFKLQYQEKLFSGKDKWENCDLEKYNRINEPFRRIVAIPIQEEKVKT